MITFRLTTPQLERFAARQNESTFSYEQVGATRGNFPAGFQQHTVRVPLGKTHGAFQAAQAALEQWSHFDTGWTRLFPPTPPIEPGTNVAVGARVAALWSVNACRIIYVVREPTLFAFGYGTLTDHAECGEERFQVEWNPEDDTVHYLVTAFYRPSRWWSRVGWRLLRRKVDRFRIDSAAAMQRELVRVASA
ncbi:MAG: DUF1990 domain-containing protein [Pirellulales bacterium]